MNNKKVFVEFDGVQKYSKVYLNGKYLGDHKGGFNSFYFDLTEYINWNGENVMVVVVSNRRNDEFRIPPMYAGNWDVYGGIYRDVRLVIKSKVYIPYQGSYKHEGGTFITTPRVTNKSADVNVRTWIKNEMESSQTVELKTSVISPEKKEIIRMSEEKEITPGEIAEYNQNFENIKRPDLWSPRNPKLYNVISKVVVNGKIVDEYETTFGFRYFNWDYKNNDLYINGDKTEILGINRHQEYPWLGDAHPKWIARMDMADIKYNLGHNFMRLTHYPNDKYLYQLADSFGIVIVEEVPNIKSIDFSEEVQEQNVREMIRRDRNHPSILFWSMGNETNDAADSKWAIEEDTTRIIHLRKSEQGGDFVEHTEENLDMENLLRVNIRGWFDTDDAPKGFSSTPENGQQASNETWQHKMARVRGGSIRGLLGENCSAWLYADHGADREYLNCILKHINPKGWVDMYRQPKYIYWLTKAYYTDNPTVFVHPHFWRKKYLGQKKNIQIDSNCEEVELFVNGVSAGKKFPSREEFNTLTFESITVEEGSLKAIGRIGGKEYVHELFMTGDPAKIVLSANQKTINADRSGIAIIIADILDKNGNPVFDATNTLNWSVTGPGKLVGASVYKSDIMKSEESEGTGYTVVPVANLIRSTDNPGEIKVTVTSEGLETCEIVIQSVISNDNVTWLTEPRLSDMGRFTVLRDSSYSGNTKVIPLTILPMEEDYQLDGKTMEDFRQQIDKFIKQRNKGVHTNYIAYSYLVEVFAKYLVNRKGSLVADDYNFFINQFNALVVVEDYINMSYLKETERLDLKRNYARKVLSDGGQINVNEELIKLR